MQKTAQKVVQKESILKILPVSSEKLCLSAMETGYLTKIIKTHISSLKLTACAYNQISLNSIGVGSNFNIFVMLKNVNQFQNNWESKTSMPHQYNQFINSKIIKASNMEQYGWEENLNFSVLKANIRRFEKIVVQHMGEKGEGLNSEFSGFEARVFQQNCSSLLGKQLIDFKLTQGNVQIKDQYKEHKEARYLQQVLDEYREFGRKYAEKNAEYFEISLEDFELPSEMQNPRVSIQQQQKQEENQNEIIEDYSVNEKIQKFYEDINEEVELLQEQLNLPQKRKIKKKVQQQKQ